MIDWEFDSRYTFEDANGYEFKDESYMFGEFRKSVRLNKTCKEIYISSSNPVFLAECGIGETEDEAMKDLLAKCRQKQKDAEKAAQMVEELLELSGKAGEVR